MKRLDEILFPRNCLLCGRELTWADPDVCWDCQGEKLSLVEEPVCLCCGKEISGDSWRCPDCRKNRRSYYGGMAVYNYNDAMRTLIGLLKYKNRRRAAEFLAQRYYKHCGIQTINLFPDALVPVPLYKRKKRERGYNQAELLAKKIGEMLEIPVENLLERVEDTAAQKDLSYEERLENEKHAFRAVKDLHEYSCLVLIDDIYTTGATAENCTRALLEAGAGRVYLGNIAITMRGK